MNAAVLVKNKGKAVNMLESCVFLRFRRFHLLGRQKGAVVLCAALALLIILQEVCWIAVAILLLTVPRY